MRGDLTGEGAAVDAGGGPAWAAAARLIAAAPAGAVGRPRGGPGWGRAAEKEVEAEGCAQVLAVTVAGLITEG